MKVRKRTLRLRQQKGAQPKPLFGMVCSDLQAALQHHLGLPRPLPGWPRVAWNDAARQVAVDAWTAEDDPSARLLTAELVEQAGPVTCTVTVRVGSLDETEIVIQEECRVDPAPANVLAVEPPDLLTFLASYKCRDDDEFGVARTYRVDKRSVEKLRKIIRATPMERRLPILVISPSNMKRDYPVPKQALPEWLQGIAHVVLLDPQSWWYKDDILPTHPCFDGAVRVYLSGYSEDDPPSVHRYWGPKAFIGDNAPDNIHQVLRFVLEKSLLYDTPNTTLELLEQARAQDSVLRQHRLQMESIRDQIRMEAERQATAEAERLWQDLVDQYHQENERLMAENQWLRQRVKEQDDQLRRLKYQFQQQWAEPEEMPAQPAPEPRVLLSGRALEVYEQLDHGERRIVDNQLLRKLSDPELRAHQTEPVEAMDGVCYVYPRSRSADGRRVIFFEDGEQVYVCELFLHHDHYEKARDRGFRVADYDGFIAWQPEESPDGADSVGEPAQLLSP